MRRRWKAASGVGATALAAVVAPILYIEGGCREPIAGLNPARPYRAHLVRDADSRAEARTWLTYPEWYIVHSAESFGRFLDRAPPSAFPYARHIAGFWTGYCQVNRVTAALPSAGDAKVMIYTIGISYSVELAIKGVYENSIGRLFEAASGWRSADDTHAAAVQRRYGAFMNETPWYAFDFGSALAGLWATREPRLYARHWERRLALTAEYGVKAGYAALIGWASGATLGRDERTIRFVVRASPGAVRNVDSRLRPLRMAADGLLIVEAPRYAQFSELAGKLAMAGIDLVEIAGNDDIFLTALVPASVSPPPGAALLLSTPLDDRPGWRRVGLSIKVSQLSSLLRRLRAEGRLEHVYDY